MERTHQQRRRKSHPGPCQRLPSASHHEATVLEWPHDAQTSFDSPLQEQQIPYAALVSLDDEYAWPDFDTPWQAHPTNEALPDTTGAEKESLSCLHTSCLNEAGPMTSYLHTTPLNLVFETSDLTLSPPCSPADKESRAPLVRWVSASTVEDKKQKRKEQNRKAQQNYRTKQELRLRELQEKLCSANIRCQQYEEIISQLQASLTTLIHPENYVAGAIKMLSVKANEIDLVGPSATPDLTRRDSI